MRQFPKYQGNIETKMIKKIKKFSLSKQKRSVEELHRSFNVVDLIMRDAHDLGLTSEVVTWALKSMKDNPEQDISDAIIAGYEQWIT
jgi:hypothetical protein